MSLKFLTPKNALEFYAPDDSTPLEIVLAQVGISAGASTPDFLVEAVIEKLVQLSDGQAELELPVKKRKINKIPRT